MCVEDMDVNYGGETLEMQPPFVLCHALNPFRQPVNIPRVINLPLAHSTKNIHTERSSPKLDKILGPFRVIAKVGDAYRLDLPATMKMHNEFHYTWYNTDDDEFRHAEELVVEFHDRHPEKPR